jgi:hypothetical protein
MTSERIKEIQQQTAYPDSISVQQALLQVWNECSQLPQQETFVSKGSYVNGDIVTKDSVIVELPQQELSDEEIEQLAKDYILYNDSKRQWYIEGMKIYREQLRNKNN